MRSKILLIEDDPSFVDSIRLMLRRYENVEVIWAATGAEGIQAFRQDVHGYATVIIDYRLPDLTGADVAQHLRKINPNQEFLFASGYRDPELLIDLLETGGARSFLVKGRPPEETRGRIMESVQHHLNTQRVISTQNHLPTKMETELRTEGLLGHSQAMYEVLQKIRKFRTKPYPTLLIGATGSGKEYVARALTPKGKRLIDIHCGRFAESENMLESELFGHVKGAFTGATHDKPGRLAQAHGQVVFLDELHTLPMAGQQKLLRFLETMKYRRMGDDSSPEISIDFKLIAAVQPDINERIERGEFLPDLLGRVGDLRIQVPSLKERPEDIELIIRYFQDEFNAGLPVCDRKQFRISTVHEMTRHSWPMNIRDLRGAVRTMMTLATGDVLNPSDFDTYLQGIGQGIRSLAAPEQSLKNTTSQVEVEKITQALKISNTVVETAGRLGLTRWTLNRKMVRLGINPESYLKTG